MDAKSQGLIGGLGKEGAGARGRGCGVGLVRARGGLAGWLGRSRAHCLILRSKLDAKGQS